jgi:hypothetical protein
MTRYATVDGGITTSHTSMQQLATGCVVDVLRKLTMLNGKGSKPNMSAYKQR